jgi:hypothetical protein
MKRTITESALIQRLNRSLAKDYEMIRKSRPKKSGYKELGDYYILDCYRNIIINSRLTIDDLQHMAREKKVMHENELIEN